MKVLVLGAGVIGVTSAWYLARAGHEVTVIDRQRDAGLETSFANGGQISADHAEPWARPYALVQMAQWLGREDAPLLYRPRAAWAQWAWGLRFLFECMPGRYGRNARELAGLARYSRDCLRELRGETGIAYDQATRGILRLSVGRDILSAEECLRIEPALAKSEIPIRGGRHFARDESGDAHKFTGALTRLSREKGVAFRFSTEVLGFQTESGKIKSVKTTTATIEADAYVVALGSYSPLLLRPLGIRIPVYPLKGYSITAELDADQQAQAPQVSITDEAQHIVISRLGNRLRAAGTAELADYDASVNRTRCDAIAARALGFFPGLRSLKNAEYWAGLRPATPTNVPVIGRTRLKNLFLNTGHGTLGWTLACGSGRALADLVSGRRPDVAFAFT